MFAEMASLDCGNSGPEYGEILLATAGARENEITCISFEMIMISSCNFI